MLFVPITTIFSRKTFIISYYLVKEVQEKVRSEYPLKIEVRSDRWFNRENAYLNIQNIFVLLLSKNKISKICSLGCHGAHIPNRGIVANMGWKNTLRNICLITYESIRDECYK